MKKAVSFMSIVSVFACFTFAQVNVNSTTNVQNGNNNNDALTSTNQYTGNAADRIGVKGLSLQQSGWGVGGDFYGGWRGVCGTATITGGSSRYGVMGTASNGQGNGSGATIYGVLGWAYNSSATKIGVKGGVWNDNGTVPADQYGVLGEAIGTPSGNIKSYGVYCKGNGAATGTWSSASDAKLKTNVKPLDDGILAKIKQLNAITYNYDVKNYSAMGFDDSKKIGFTAQNIEAVFPELVRDEHCPITAMPKNGKTDKGVLDSVITYKGVDYNGLIPVLLKAIQEQQKQIDALTAKIGK